MSPDLIKVMCPNLPTADAVLPYIREIDNSGWYSNFGPLQRRLETRIAEHYRLTDGTVACVNNGTAGLMLALMATSRKRGGFCILPSFTFAASAHAVLAAGLVPYFIDVNRDDWAISPDAVLAGVASAPGDVSAVMVVAPFGAPMDIGVWDEFSDRHNLPVVIDAAAGFDSLIPGRSPAVVSFHATKILSAGEGGAIISRDMEIVRSVAARSNFGFSGDRHASALGFNAKLSEYAAAVALASLDAWPETRTRYDERTRQYCAALAGVADVSLSPGFGNGWVSSTCNISIEAPAAVDAMARLRDAGIDSRQWWGKGCHMERAFEAFPRTDLRVTEDLGEQVLGLPFHLSLTGSDITRIAETVSEIMHS